MGKKGEFEWWVYDAKVVTPISSPNPTTTAAVKVSNGKKPIKGFIGYGAKASAKLVLVKREDQITPTCSTKVEGPTISGSIGATTGTDNTLAAIVEPSLASVQGSVSVTENVSTHASLGINATTGLKINNEGVKFGLLGFGLTLGVGGKWEINTPAGSVGFDAPGLCVAEKETVKAKEWNEIYAPSPLAVVKADAELLLH